MGPPALPRPPPNFYLQAIPPRKVMLIRIPSWRSSHPHIDDALCDHWVMAWHVTRWEVDVLPILWLDFLVSFLTAGWWAWMRRDEMSGVGRAHTMTLDTVAWWYAARRLHPRSVQPSSPPVIYTVHTSCSHHQWHHNKHQISSSLINNRLNHAAVPAMSVSTQTIKYTGLIAYLHDYMKISASHFTSDTKRLTRY